MMLHKISFILMALLFQNCNNPVNFPDEKKVIDVQKEILQLKLPKGFKIEVFADSLTNARSIAKANDHEIYIGTRQEGKVYAAIDTDKDWKADQKFTLLKDKKMPNGVAYRDGDLYIAEVSTIHKVTDISNNLQDNIETEIIYEDYPTESHHGWKFISFGPDDKLYIPVGAPCNICESEDPQFASITRMNPDGTDKEVIQHGVRNTVGFTWHPQTGDLWFTDNGRDWMGDDMPACELNRATKDNMHFGYPYCHQGDTLDDEFGKNKSCDDYTKPVQNLSPHCAPLGCEFYQAGMFPDSYSDCIFIAEHGSWNREKKIGYRISIVRLDENGNSIGYEDFISGWLDDSTDDVWGRPVDLEWLSDGSMLISDDMANVVYRVSYTGA